jgi:urea transport system permease protein
VRDDKGDDPVTGAAATCRDDAEDVVNNNRMRGELDSALSALKLFSKDAKCAPAAPSQLLAKEPDESKLPLIEKAYAAEQDADQGAAGPDARAQALLTSTDKARARSRAIAGRQPQPRPRAAAADAAPEGRDRGRREDRRMLPRAHIEASLVWGERAAAVFSGISLGSILLLARWAWPSPTA